MINTVLGHSWVNNNSGPKIVDKHADEEDKVRFRKKMSLLNIEANGGAV